MRIARFSFWFIDRKCCQARAVGSTHLDVRHMVGVASDYARSKFLKIAQIVHAVSRPLAFVS